MSRRRKPPRGIVPGSSVPVVCTGRDTHRPSHFGKVALTSSGRVYAELSKDRTEYRMRRDSDPDWDGQISLGKRAQTVHFRCSHCGLDYQRQLEVFREYVKTLLTSGFTVLDVSKMLV